MLQAVYENIIQLLQNNEIPFDEIDHPAVQTTDDSLKYRQSAGWMEGIGSKNIVFHAKGNFHVVVTTADKNLKARIFKKEFGTKDIRFAYPDEVREYTGCIPGAIPPFGHTHPEIPIYIDKNILSFEFFMFNPGLHTKSLRIKPDDIIKIYQILPNPTKWFILSDDGVDFEEIEKAGVVE